MAPNTSATAWQCAAGVIADDDIPVIGQLDDEPFGGLIEPREGVDDPLVRRRTALTTTERNENANGATEGGRAPPGVSDVAARLALVADHTEREPICGRDLERGHGRLRLARAVLTVAADAGKPAQCVERAAARRVHSATAAATTSGQV
jgi:hypothetical protein